MRRGIKLCILLCLTAWVFSGMGCLEGKAGELKAKSCGKAIAVSSAPNELPGAMFQGKGQGPSQINAPPPPVEETQKLEAAPISRSGSYATMRAFISEYLRANENRQRDKVLSFYGERIDYYSMGVVPKSYIVKDKDEFFKAWFSLKYFLRNDLQVVKVDNSDTLRLIFTFDFTMVTSRKTIKGTAKNIWEVENGDSNPKIILEKQNIIRRESF